MPCLQVEEWKSKGHTVERRPLRQWMLRITKYAQRLVDELEPLDWPTSVKLLQENWIGRFCMHPQTPTLVHTHSSTAHHLPRICDELGLRPRA